MTNLGTLATQLKRAGDLNGAIDALKKQRGLMSQSFVRITTEAWCRLPLFLQQAGRYEEAIAEFQSLLDVAESWIANDFSHLPEFMQRGHSHHVKATIYDKMRVAAKREKHLEAAERYGKLSGEYFDEHEKFMRVADLYRKREAAKRAAKRAANN